MKSNLPPGCTPQMIEDQCGPDEFEIDQNVIDDAVKLATDDVLEEAMSDILNDEAVYTVLKAAIMPTAKYAIKARVDEYLDNYRTDGEFR